MNYVLVVLLAIYAIKPLNYAKYNWTQKQYFQSIGVVFIVILMIGLPVYVMFSQY